MAVALRESADTVPLVPLGELCQIVGGGTPSKKEPAYYQGIIPWVTVKDFTGINIVDTVDHITDKAVSVSATNIIPAGTVLVVTRVGLGKVAMITRDMAINQDIKALFPDDRLLPEYLFWFLVSQENEIQRMGVGATVKGITLPQLKNLSVPLPSHNEQRRIVDILKRADGIRRLRKQAQDTARQLTPALFIEMFGDDREVEGSSTATIQELAELRKGSIRTGPFGSQLKHSEFTDSGIPVLGIDNVVTNRFRWATERYLPTEKYQKFKRFRVFPGDLIVTIMGTTGRIVVTPDDLPESMSTKHLCVVSLQKEVIQPYYAWASVLFDPYVRSQVCVSGHGAIMEGWNTSIVKNLRLRVPSIDLQNEFVARLENIQSITVQQEAAQGSAESSFQSLLHRAFSGKN